MEQLQQDGSQSMSSNSRGT